MYQRVIRDTGTRELVRVSPNIGSDREAVVNGSRLIVPPQNVAFVSVNGELSEPYPPGRHEIFTGTSPFFVRLRNLMRHGDAAVDVRVFFVSQGKTSFLSMGTGEMLFCDKRFRVTLKAFALCRVTYTIADPKRVLTRLFGAWRDAFDEEEFTQCLEQTIRMPVREVMSRRLSVCEAANLSASLPELTRAARGSVAEAFAEYGLRLLDFGVTALNLPEDQQRLLNDLEREYASGRTKTDLEADNIARIWGGDVERRTRAEMLTGVSNRGQAAPNAASSMAQMMLMAQMMPQITRRMQAAGSSPVPPRRSRRCPHCRAQVPANARFCPSCGESLT